MDPNLFHLDWERVSEVLAAIVVLAFLSERALAVIFEHRWFLKYFDQRGVKEIIAFGVCALICVRWNFDALSMVFLTDHTTRLGELVTGAVVAGGSKASIKLFHDVLNTRSSAHEQLHPTDPDTKKPKPETTAAARAAL